MANDILKPDVYSQIDTIESADIVIGIPSYNNADTIGHVVKAAMLGAAKYYPHLKCVIINSDGGSTDATQKVFLETSPFNEGDRYFADMECIPVRKLTFAYQGLPGKGSAFRSIFEAAYILSADLCIVVDSDLRSITPEWFETLGYPILYKDYDYVTPYYLRHKYDGTITNSIAYPFTRALYGLDIRQPIGGDFGVSGSLLPVYLSQDVWESDTAKYGIDIWMTTTAIANQCKIAQAFLGCKIHDAKDPGEHLGPMFRQVVSTLMKLAGQNIKTARNIKQIQKVPILGFPYASTPEPLPVNLNRLVDKFNTGFTENIDNIRSTLSDKTFNDIKSLLNSSVESFDFPIELWVKTVFEYALKIAGGSPPELIDSLIPIYYGNVAAFVKKADSLSPEEAEELILNNAKVFFSMRDIFINGIASASSK